jgi:hypothetical protein
MKKSVYLFSILLFLLATATGCSDKGEEPELNFLELESANVSFDSYGGEGDIVVKATAGVTASSAATWCTTTTSGNKVTVTVPLYEELLGRSTVVTLVSGGKKVLVPVTQSGLELKVESKTVELPGTASDTTLQINSPVQVTAQSNATWLTVNLTAANVLELHAAANNASFAQRTAVVTLTAGPIEVAVTVIQKGALLTFNNCIGTWTLTHTIAAATTGTKYTKTALVTDGGGYLDVELKNGTTTSAGTMFYFAMDYDAGTGKVNILPQIIGVNGSNYIIIANFNGSSVYTSGGLVGAPTGGTVNNPVLTFTDDGTGSHVSIGFILWQMDASTGALAGEYSGYGGSPATSRSRYTNITMTKR